MILLEWQVWKTNSCKRKAMKQEKRTFIPLNMGKAEVTIPQTTKSSELDIIVGASHQRPNPRDKDSDNSIVT